MQNLTNITQLADGTIRLGDNAIFTSHPSEYGLKIPVDTAYSGILVGNSLTSGLEISATYPSAVTIFAQDSGSNLGSSVHGCALRARFNITCTTTQEAELDGIRGQMVHKAGGTLDHNVTAVLGSFEVTTTALAFVGSVNKNYQAGVVGRMAIGVASCTLDANARVAGVAAVRGSTSAPTVTSGGVLAGFYSCADAGAQDWLWGMWLEDCKQGIYAAPSYGALTSGEMYGINIQGTVGAMTGGTGYVAGNFVANATTAGAGAWVSGVYGKGLSNAATSPVDGYVSGGEFECTMTGAQNPCAHFAIVANMTDTTTGSANGQNAWIAIRDYGTADRSNNLLWFGTEITIGSGSDSVLVSTVGADNVQTHGIKILVGGTTMWLMATTELCSGG